MYKKTLVLLSLILSVNLCQAQDGNQFLSRTYDFKPNLPLSVDNPVYWTVNMTCKVETTDITDSLSAIVKKKSGSINGTRLNEGDTFALTVSNGDEFKIEAKGGARVEITNHGSSHVVAKCKT